METRAPGSLPPRDSALTLPAPALVSARQKVGIVAMILAAVVLAAVVFAFTPRPDIVVQDTVYTSSGCVASGVAQVVTATFTLFNRGPADGTVRVSLLVDDHPLSSQTYSVPSQASVPGRIEATLQDCSAHRYGLSSFYEAPPSG